MSDIIEINGIKIDAANPDEFEPCLICSEPIPVRAYGIMCPECRDTTANPA